MGYLLRSPGRQAISSETDRASTNDRAPGPANGAQSDQANTKRTPLTKAPSDAPTALAAEARPEVDPKPSAGNAIQNSNQLLRGMQRDPKLMQERMERLRRGQDDATRLAAAREILDDEAAGPMRNRALSVLMELDPDSVLGALQKMAEGAAGDPRKSAMLQGAIQNLSRYKDVLSADELTSFYEGGSQQIKSSLARTLAARGDDSLSLRYQEESARNLADEDPRVRSAAISALSALGSESAFALVHPLLKDKSDEVRMAALRSLQGNMDPSVIDHIRPMLDDPSEQVSQTAKRMLERMELRLERQRGLPLDRRRQPRPC